MNSMDEKMSSFLRKVENNIKKRIKLLRGFYSELGIEKNPRTAHIDECIKEEIFELNERYNIHTISCCCGHRKGKEYIAVEREKDAIKMLELGYLPRFDFSYPSMTLFGGITYYPIFKPKNKCRGDCNG